MKDFMKKLRPFKFWILLLAVALGFLSFCGKNTFDFVVYRSPADGGETLVAEKIQIKKNSKSLPENALEYLLYVKPVDERAFQDGVPDKTELLGLKVQKGIAYVNFSQEVNKKTMGSYEATMFIGAVVNTLTEFKDIQAVQILIEGQKRRIFGGVLDIGEPLTRNESLLEKSR